MRTQMIRSPEGGIQSKASRQCARLVIIEMETYAGTHGTREMNAALRAPNLSSRHPWLTRMGYGNSAPSALASTVLCLTIQNKTSKCFGP